MTSRIPPVLSAVFLQWALKAIQSLSFMCVCGSRALCACVRMFRLRWNSWPFFSQFVELMSRRQGELDALVATGYKSALTEERRRYCFLVDRQCCVTKLLINYHCKVICSRSLPKKMFNLLFTFGRRNPHVLCVFFTIQMKGKVCLSTHLQAREKDEKQLIYPTKKYVQFNPDVACSPSLHWNTVVYCGSVQYVLPWYCKYLSDPGIRGNPLVKIVPKILKTSVPSCFTETFFF